MLPAILMVLVVAVILGLRQNSNKKVLKKNPNDRNALLKLFNACDAPFTYEEASELGIAYLQNNPDDFEIMNLCAYGFAKNKSAPGIRKLLDSRIVYLESIVDDQNKLKEYVIKDKDFKVYAKNLFTYYANALKAYKEIDKSNYYENKAKYL